MDPTTLTDDALAALHQQVTAEVQRRATISSARQQVSDANAVILGSEGIKPGDPWRAPAAAAQAYPKGWVCTVGGTHFVATVDGTWQMPGTGQQWSEVPADEVETRTAASPETI